MITIKMARQGEGRELVLVVLRKQPEAEHL